MAERLKEAEAFDFWYSLGENRTYETVANKFGVSVPAISQWAKKNNWKERLAVRDAENAKEIFKQTDKTIVESAREYRKVIEASIFTYVTALKAGKVKITSPADFIRLVELDLKLANIGNDQAQAAMSAVTQETLSTVQGDLSDILNKFKIENGEVKDEG